jgi:hypothetical protein
MNWQLGLKVVPIKLRQDVTTSSELTAAHGRFSYTILWELMTDMAIKIKQSPSSHLQTNGRSTYATISPRR